MPTTATTTKKSNNGSCAACKKEGAVLRCAPCRDAGVDVFFCNRECQVKLWKIHKAVCKKTCNAELNKEVPSANKEAKEDGKKGLQFCRDTNACVNCMKTHADIGFKLSMCSKCQSVYYCSRECQVEDWPKHKRMCKQNCESLKGIERSLDSLGMNIHNLFQKWLAKILKTDCFSDVIYIAFKKKGIEQQPPMKVVLLEVEFNYNAQTFVVTEEPRAMAISDLSQEDKASISRILKERTGAGRIDQLYNHFVLLSTKEFGKRFERTVGIGITKEVLDEMKAHQMKIDMEQLRNACAHVRLKSDLFRGWKSIRRSNLQKQMEQMKFSQSCTAFVQNELQFFCNKSMQNTHRVIVYMDIGKEIGQISRFQEYGVVSIAEFKKFKEENEKKIIIHVKDIESRPPLCTEMAIETLFVDCVLGFAFEYTVLCGVNGMHSKTAKQCKKAADKHFRKLQREVKEMPADLLVKVSL